MKKISILIVLLLAVLFFTGCSKEKSQEQQSIKNIEQNQNQQGKDDKREMPAESFEACEGKSEGDSCELTMPKRNDSEENEDNKMTGTCKKTQEDKLSCMPENNGGPGEPGGKEKPEENNN